MFAQTAEVSGAGATVDFGRIVATAEEYQHPAASIAGIGYGISPVVGVLERAADRLVDRTWYGRPCAGSRAPA